MGGCVAQVCTVVEKLAREQGIFGDEAIVCNSDDCFFLHGAVSSTSHAHLDCPDSSSHRYVCPPPPPTPPHTRQAVVLCAVPDSGPCVGRQYQFSAVLQGSLQFKLERRVKLQGRAKDLQELYVEPRAKEVKVQANEVR